MGGLAREREGLGREEEEGQDGQGWLAEREGTGQEEQAVDDERQRDEEAVSDPFSLRDTGARGAAKAVEAVRPFPLFLFLLTQCLY